MCASFLESPFAQGLLSLHKNVHLLDWHLIRASSSPNPDAAAAGNGIHENRLSSSRKGLLRSDEEQIQMFVRRLKTFAPAASFKEYCNQ